MPASLTRRRVLGLVAFAAGAVPLLFVAQGRGVFVRGGGSNALAPGEAHRRALTGEVVLIDIRRPDEWAATGVAEGAHPLDMRRKDFLTALAVVAGQPGSTPIALICARGVRSAHLAAHLEGAGYTQILDVPEGMLGSGAGPGWLHRGLPVRASAP